MRLSKAIQLTDTPAPDLNAPVSEKGFQGEILDFLFYLRLFAAHWWVILPIIVFGAAAAYAFCKYTQPIYRAECRFEIFQDNGLQIDDYTNIDIAYRQLRRHILIMESVNVEDEVDRSLAVKWGSRLPENYGGPKLEIKPVLKSSGSMIDIKVSSFDPDYSLDYLNALIDGYQEMRKDEARLIIDNRLTALRAEIERLSKELTAARVDVTVFEKSHEMEYKRKLSEGDQQLLSNLMDERETLRVQRMTLESQFAFLQNANAATLYDILELALPQRGDLGNQDTIRGPNENGNGRKDMVKTPQWSAELQEWRANEVAILRLTAIHKVKAKTFKPGHPVMVDLREQIAAAERDLEIAGLIALKRLRARYDALKMQEKAIAKTAKTIELEVNISAKDQYTYDQLQSRVTHIKELHDTVFAMLVSEMSTDVDPYYSRLVENPFALEAPVWPVTWKVVSAGLAGSIFVSFAFVFLMFIYHRRLHDFDELERNVRLSCLIGVPKFELDGLQQLSTPRGIVVRQGIQEVANECFRSLRTSIASYFNLNGKVGAGKLILVTSAEATEGKTFTALNLAAAFSWSHRKILIIDGDFHRPSLHRAFDIHTAGLMDCLVGPGTDWRDCVRGSGIDNLAFLPAGMQAKNSTELLDTAHFDRVLDEIRAEFDIIIIDSAPVNIVVDSVVLAEKVDAILLVAQAAKTTTHALRYCLSRLPRNKLMGYVLNLIDPSSYKYSYYQFKKNGYAYYGKQYAQADSTQDAAEASVGGDE